MLKKLIILIILLVVIVGGISFYLFNKKVPTLESVEAEYVMTANELFDSFEADETAALEKYEGKVILVKGRIAQLEDTKKKFNVILEAKNAMMGGVNCAFSIKPSGIKVGDQVEVKGRCQGYLMNVVVNNCVLINE